MRHCASRGGPASSRIGARGYRATLPESDRTSHNGYPVTSVARTVLDIAREHGVTAGVVAADCALHNGQMVEPELADAFDVCKHWPGTQEGPAHLHALRRPSRVPAGVSKPAGASTSGVPSPELQVELCDELGRFVGRSDFDWPAFGVVGEADGEGKYQSRLDLLDERRRQRRLEDLGLIVERWGWADLAQFDEVAARLRRAFARAQLPGRDRRWGVLGLRAESGPTRQR